MPQTRINCPSCRQPIMAEIEQLFDVGADPAAKQRLLSGAVNVAACPSCGFRGSLATPIVYHDPDKELLLTFVPTEIGLPRDQQERLIGQLINQAINRLPMEKRKGYLLNPTAILTQQGLVERILESDGITREMLQASQAKLSLLQRLLGATEDVREVLIQQEAKLIDSEFFSLFGRLGEAIVASGDRQGAQKLSDLQKLLLEKTEMGRQLAQQANEVQAAVESLRSLGENLTRESLLDLVINAPTDTRLSALASMARPAMDYEFFRLLSDRIDRARSDGRARLIEIREKLLEITRQVDKEMEARLAAAQQLITKLLAAPDIKKATAESIEEIDEFFLNVLNAFLEEARKKGDLEKIAKLNQVVAVLQEASKPPAELTLVEDLLDAPDEAARRLLLANNREKITPELIDTLNNLSAQIEKSEDKALAARVKDVYRQVLRYSMELQLGK